MKSLFNKEVISRWLRSPIVTFGILIEAILLPTVCVVWLVGRASDNERAALRQAYQSIQRQELQFVRNRTLETVERIVDPNESDYGWFIFDAEIHAKLERKFFPPSPEGDVLLNELRYLYHTFGTETAIAQIRYYISENMLDDLWLSDRRNLKASVLLMAMNLSEIDQEEFAGQLVDFLLSDSEPKSNEHNNRAFRLFLSTKALKIYPDHAGLLDLMTEDRATISLLEQADSGWFKTENDGFQVWDDWVLYSIPSKDDNPNGNQIWFSRLDHFKQNLIGFVGGEPAQNGRSLDIIEPGNVIAETEDERIIVDLGVPLEGWRLVSMMDEKEWMDPAQERVLFYLLVGFITTAASIIFASIGMGMVRNEMTLAKLKNDLAATVSHELKTPIASVRLLTETLLHGGSKLDPKTSEYLQLIYNENKRLGQLVEKFLTFSRMERGNQVIEPELTDARTLVTQAEEIFRERFSTQQYRLTVDTPESNTPVLADAQGMLSAIGNLLENAFKYSKQPREIRLSLKKEKDQVVFAVEDNGEGIAPSEQKKIFRKFYQPDRRLNNHRGGVGLGLGIVAYVVKQHNAKIELESQQGEGSIFRIKMAYAKDTHH